MNNKNFQDRFKNRITNVDRYGNINNQEYEVSMNQPANLHSRKSEYQPSPVSNQQTIQSQHNSAYANTPTASYNQSFNSEQHLYNNSNQNQYKNQNNQYMNQSDFYNPQYHQNYNQNHQQTRHFHTNYSQPQYNHSQSYQQFENPNPRFMNQFDDDQGYYSARQSEYSKNSYTPSAMSVNSSGGSRIKTMKYEIDDIQSQIANLELENTSNFNNKSNSPRRSSTGNYDNRNKNKNTHTQSHQSRLINSGKENHSEGYLSKLNKEVTYKPYSLKDYQKINKNPNSKLPSSLGPNIGSDEWVDRKAKQLKMAEFGNQINNINKQTVVSDPQRYKAKEEEYKQDQKRQAEDMVQRRNEYAKNVPKPKARSNIVADDEINKLERELYENEDVIRKLKQKYIN